APSTQFQARSLLNWGVKSDVAIATGRHDLKIGIDLKQTRLQENFGFGITDETFNPVCLDNGGNAARAPSLTNPANCAQAGPGGKPGFSPGPPPLLSPPPGTPLP